MKTASSTVGFAKRRQIRKGGTASATIINRNNATVRFNKSKWTCYFYLDELRYGFFSELLGSVHMTAQIASSQ